MDVTSADASVEIARVASTFGQSVQIGIGMFSCTLSTIDPRFAMYPRLPVLSCSGYDKQSA